MSENPAVGDMMPDIALTGPDGAPLRPSDLRGRMAVLFFYPRDDTPGCTTENRDFSALKPRFEAAGAALLGISRDPPAKHAKFTAKHDLTVSLATDREEESLAEALGVWGGKLLYGKLYKGLTRSTYLLDAEGRIAQVWPKVKAKGHAQEVLAAVEGLARGA